MGLQHTTDLSKYVQGAAGNGYFVTVEEPNDRYKQNHRIFSLVTKTKKAETVAKLALRTLPGCCGVLLAYNISGIGTEHILSFLSTVVRAARKAKYGAVLFTLLEDRPIIRELTGLQLPFSNTRVRNGKTGNVVSVITVDLQQPEPRVSRIRSEEGE